MESSHHGATGSARVSRYDVSGTGSTLNTTMEWNLTADLPVVGANLGFEGITWIPDSLLTGAGLVDESTGAPYDPARYGPHTGGGVLPRRRGHRHDLRLRPAGFRCVHPGRRGEQWDERGHGTAVGAADLAAVGGVR